MHTGKTFYDAFDSSITGTPACSHASWWVCTPSQFCHARASTQSVLDTERPIGRALSGYLPLSPPGPGDSIACYWRPAFNAVPGVHRRPHSPRAPLAEAECPLRRRRKDALMTSCVAPDHALPSATRPIKLPRADAPREVRMVNPRSGADRSVSPRLA